MTPETLQTFFSQDLIALAVKALVVMVVFLYTIFAVIVVRQVQTMNKVLTIANFSPILSLTTILHLMASLGLLIAAFIIL